MKYSRAAKVLPQTLLSAIQQYVQGELLYIPKIKENHKKWGENTHSKSLILLRNDEIRLAFKNGATINELSSQYFLSICSIKKIVYRKS